MRPPALGLRTTGALGQRSHPAPADHGGPLPRAVEDSAGGRRRARPALIAITALFALAGSFSTARAQVSPGPLAAAHHELDSITKCFACHATGADMTTRCLACHTEIAWMRQQNRGFHARRAKAECAKCHPDHAGADFALVRWDSGSPERFHHADAGYALDGKHATLACRDCHQAKNQRSPAVARIRKRDHNASWLGLETACAGCHSDPHAGRFGADCQRCHAPTGWNQIREAGFDHDRTRYPLRGRHATVACASCHDAVKAWGPKPAFDRCTACHRDAHAGRATLAGRPADCSACHTVEGYQTTTFTVEMHQRSAYPLEGRHAALACESCHIRLPKGEREDLVGTSGVLLRPLHDACARCHVDAHGGQLASQPGRGACESCHTVRGFKPSTFTVASHARLKLRLEGRHAVIDCAACHGAARASLPPPVNAAKAGSAGFAFRIAEVECAQCHVDPHQGRFSAKGERAAAAGCVACHGLTDYNAATFDVARHQATRFPLVGAHGAVPCTGCHAELASRPKRSSLVLAPARPAPLLFAVERRDCAGCHQGPHGNQFQARADHGACDACHGVERFRPADRFQHDRDTSFRLQGAHARVACAACHRTERGPRGATRAVYTGTPSRCEACHATGGKT